MLGHDEQVKIRASEAWILNLHQHGEAAIGALNGEGGSTVLRPQPMTRSARVRGGGPSGAMVSREMARAVAVEPPLRPADIERFLDQIKAVARPARAPGSHAGLPIMQHPDAAAITRRATERCTGLASEDDDDDITLVYETAVAGTSDLLPSVAVPARWRLGQQSLRLVKQARDPDRK